jgi:hypothetical protein
MIGVAHRKTGRVLRSASTKNLRENRKSLREVRPNGQERARPQVPCEKWESGPVFSRLGG